LSSLFALLLFAALATAAVVSFVGERFRARLRWALRAELLLVWLAFVFSLRQIGLHTALALATFGHDRGRGAVGPPPVFESALGQVGTLLISLGGPGLLVTFLALWALRATRAPSAPAEKKKKKRSSARIAAVRAAGRDLDEVRRLFDEYARALDFELGVPLQGFQDEVRGLPGAYVAPGGRLLLARIGGQAAGCVAVLRGEDGLAEMKRLFVRPAFRHAGLGRALAEASLAAAAELGCARTRLDTLASMREAIGLYRSLGFVERPAPQAGSQGPLFFERESRRPRS